MRKRCVYEEIRDLVKRLKGKMHFERPGYQSGPWIIGFNGKLRIFRSNGSGYPELDKLYQPKPGVREPKHWKDYTNTLRPGAKKSFLICSLIQTMTEQPMPLVNALPALFSSGRLQSASGEEQLDKKGWAYDWNSPRPI